MKKEDFHPNHPIIQQHLIDLERADIATEEIFLPIHYFDKRKELIHARYRKVQGHWQFVEVT